LGKADCRVIANGIDTAVFCCPKEKGQLKVKYGYSSEEKIVLGVAVGYRDRRKGVEYILGLAKEMPAVRFILIGWNEKLNSMKKGLNNVVTRKTVSDMKILADYYGMADVFVIPSLAENYATTVLEALACGTPVVGFDIGGIPRQLEGGKGLTVPLGDKEAFYKAVHQVLYEEDSVLRGEALAGKLREVNTAERMAEEYLTLYEQVLTYREKKND
jgi:glycosyltransferase involved in cell wall biosynthesis